MSSFPSQIYVDPCWKSKVEENELNLFIKAFLFLFNEGTQPSVSKGLEELCLSMNVS